MSETRRGTCQVCGGTFLLSAAGRIRRHPLLDEEGRSVWPHESCPGTGRKPA